MNAFAAHPPQLRIALVTETFPPEVNGVAMTLGRLVDGLLERGHLVQIVRPRQGAQDAPSVRVGVDEVLAKGLPIPRYKDLRFGLPAGASLARLWQQSRPDVVHVATEGPLGWSAVAAARKLRLPVTSSFHTNFHNYSGHYSLGLLKTPIEAYLRKLHNRTLATLVPTAALRDELARRGYKNLALMSRGVATERFHPAMRSAALRESWGAGPDDLVLLSVGRLAKEKNMGALLAAYAAVQGRLPRARLVLVGDGPLRQALQEASPNAVFSGVRTGTDLATHYASGDVFLFPSLSETFGNVVPEALASGLAVLSYRRAAAAELIKSGLNGQLVDEGDEVAFIREALALCQAPARIAALRAQAPASVAHLAWSPVLDSFEATLRGVIAQQGGLFAVGAIPAIA